MGEHDLISRSALLKRLQGVLAMVENEPVQTYANAIRTAMTDVRLAPAVDAEPVRRGRWTECDWVMYDGHSECIHFPKAAWRCSACCNAFKKQFMYKRNYCPNCGAKMNVEVQDD